jgi:hypothetical protein
MVASLLKDMKQEGLATSQGGGVLPYTLQRQHTGLLDCLTLVREATADTIEAVRHQCCCYSLCETPPCYYPIIR